MDAPKFAVCQLQSFWLIKRDGRDSKALVSVESVRKIGSQTTTSKRYYLNSFTSDAHLQAHAVRSHWGIEKRCDPAEVSSAWERAPRDRLHWVLDVAFAEDDCSINSDHAPENLARLRKMSLNLLSQEKTAKIGVANKRCGMHRQASTRTRSGEPVGSKLLGIITI
jgi:predicted transposase YbfD/YdcC